MRWSLHVGGYVALAVRQLTQPGAQAASISQYNGLPRCRFALRKYGSFALQTSSLAPTGLPDPILEELPLLSMLQRCYLWYMETLFACLKTRGFRFEDTHLTDPDRVSKMVALLAIAFVWAHQTGEWLHQQRPIPLKKPCSVDSSPSSAMALTTCAMPSSI